MSEILSIFGASILFAGFGVMQLLRRGCPGPEECSVADGATRCGGCHLHGKHDEDG